MPRMTYIITIRTLVGNQDLYRRWAGLFVGTARSTNENYPR